MRETQPHAGDHHYYDRRAPEYEDIYRRDDPERRAELTMLADRIRALFAGKRVLEIACGTGYWTAIIADVAVSTTAIDASPAMLEEARLKRLPASVTFLEGDAFALEEIFGDFDAALANFWLSHVPRARLPGFLDDLRRRLGSGAVVFLADNIDVPGFGGERVRKPGCADTFKLRRLADGSEHQILKNYFEPPELETLLAPGVLTLDIQAGRFYWWASFVVG